MDDIKQIENINRCAIRISDELGVSLYGSGILYLAMKSQHVFIFTAAHVIDNMNLSHNGDKKRVKFALKDSYDGIKTIDVECSIINSEKVDFEVGDIYVHKDYITGKFINDVAMICITKEDWMSELKSFQIGDCELSDRQIAYGFPESSNNEAGKENNTILAGKSKLVCDVVDKHEKRYVFDYSNKSVQEDEVTREHIMNGFSGSGLFSLQKRKYKLCGIVSSPYGKETAGKQAYAIKANLLLEMMEQYNLDVEIPKSFQLHRELIREEYNNRLGYEEERDIFDYYTEKLIQNQGFIPENVFENSYEDINCKQQKNACEDYWVGQLKKCVIFGTLKDVPVDNMKKPHIRLPEPYSEFIVEIKFLCSNEKFDTVIRELIYYDSFNNGLINDNTIILWNNHRDDISKMSLFPRKKFRRAMKSIIESNEDKYSASEMARKLSGVTGNNNGIRTFDIIRGDISKCNLALIGTNRILESIENISNIQNLEEMKNKLDNQLREIWRD